MNENDFCVGTVFIGNETKHKMKIIKIEERSRKSGSENKVNKIAVIENLKTKMKFCCGFDTLINGNITIIGC